MVAKYFSLRMASFSAPLRYCIAIVRFTSWSICINRLIKYGKEVLREGGREGGREGDVVTAKIPIATEFSTFKWVTKWLLYEKSVLTSWTYSKS